MPIPNSLLSKKWLLRLPWFLRYPDLWVLLAFVLFNGILLLPNFVFNHSESRQLSTPGGAQNSLNVLFITKENLDLVKVNIEVTLLLAIWANLAGLWKKTVRGWFWRIFLTLYSLSLVYKTYAGIMEGIYQIQPNFYNDSTFISGGLPFFFGALELPGWYFLAFGSGLVFTFVILWLGTRAFFIHLPVENLRRFTRSILAGFALLILVYSWIYRSTLSDSRNMVNSVGVEITDNIRSSLESRQAVAAFDITSPFRAYDYAQYTLREKPDVYLIMLESYGSVLYTKEHFQDLYLDFLSAFEEQIKGAGWSATSIFSKAPTWGGGTWISYTNVMLGLSIQEQSQYAALHQAYQQIPYPNMGRYLHTQGYEHVWVAPIQRRISPEHEAADDNFFGVDRWITLESMNYQGPLYGWGPSPPDQYTFGYIGDYHHAQQQPTFLVFLTQNSHYPWKPMPSEVIDWRTFAEMKPDDDLLKENSEKQIVFRESRQNYINAMAYTLKALGEFITNLDNPDAVIILIGDHQPPAVSYKGDGYKTMVHIISQDDVFLSNFKKYGFTDGFILNDLNVNMLHEGFYSLFVHNLVARYGETPQTLPPYLPNGLLFTRP